MKTMKAMCNATLLATATVMFCGLTQAQALTPFPQDTAPVSTLDSLSDATAENSGAGPVLKDILPVLMLTDTMGDSAMELSGGGAKLYKLTDFDFKTPRAMVYLDVDTFDRNSKVNMEALALAREAGWPVVIESFAWDSAAVARATAELFPDIKTAALENTSVLIERGASGWTATDTVPSTVAVKSGVSFSETSEGKAVALNNDVSKARAPDSYLAPFASYAYQANPGSQSVWGNMWTLSHNRDVVKVFKRDVRGGLGII
jgi:hypothetical protein